MSSIFPTKATEIHCNKPGHGLKDVRITILEQMKTPEDGYRKEGEKNHYYHKSGANKTNRSRPVDSQKPHQYGIYSDCKTPFTLDART